MIDLTEPLFAVHRTLFTTPKVKGYMREFENSKHVAIVYAPSETLPTIGDVVNTSRPDREVVDPLDVRVVEVILQARVRGPDAPTDGMVVNLVIGELLPAGPRSYPDAITSPADPPTVSGTDVTKPT